MYYLDTGDGDGLGYDAGGQGQMYCEDAVPDGWVSNVMMNIQTVQVMK